MSHTLLRSAARTLVAECRLDVQREVDQSGDSGQIDEQVAERGDQRALEAVRRDRLADVSNRERRHVSRLATSFDS